MATSINSYSVRLGMDASGFVDATKVSRSEARALIKDIEGARDPMERFAVEQDRLTRALNAGAIDQGTYNRLLDSKRVASVSATAALGPLAMGITAAGAAAVAAAASGAAFVGWIRDVQNKIDDAADAAERAGLSFAELGNLRFGFGEGGGVDGKTVEDSIKKLQVNMAKAIDGDQGLRDAFAKLGLDAGQMMAQGPQQAILAIADGMAGIGDHAERMKVSMELFGKSGVELASTLGKGSEALQEAFAFNQRWAALTDSQVAGVGSLNDDFGRISTIIDGTTNKVAAELAPAFEIIADAILKGAEGVSGIDTYIKNAVTTATMLVGTFQDGLDVVNEINELLGAVATMDLDRIKQGISPEATTMDKTLSAWATLEKNRKDARLAGIEAAEKREAEKHAKDLEATEKEIKAKEDATKRLADEEKRQQQQLDRERRQMAENALKAAEQHFEKEVQRQEKMRADVAKGPGAGMELGSAEAAKYLAQQANTAIADSVVKVDQKPTEDQLLEEAKKQLEFLQKDAQARDKKTDKLILAIEDNGWEAI